MTDAAIAREIGNSLALPEPLSAPSFAGGERTLKRARVLASQSAIMWHVSFVRSELASFADRIDRLRAKSVADHARNVERTSERASANGDTALPYKSEP